jgi:hypothetical protein
MFRPPALIAVERFAGAMLFGTAWLLAGCGGPTADPALVAKYRNSWQLADEPAGGQAVAEIRELVAAPAESSLTESAAGGPPQEAAAAAPPPAAARSVAVVVVGSVGGLPNPSAQSQPDYPFDKGRAVVFLADPATVAEHESGGHQHAPGEECAFCAAHAADMADMLAVVRFRDEQGKVAAVDIRDLFGLQEKDTVVVRGVARLEAGMLVVDADGLYLRR